MSFQLRTQKVIHFEVMKYAHCAASALKK